VLVDAKEIGPVELDGNLLPAGNVPGAVPKSANNDLDVWSLVEKTYHKLAGCRSLFEIPMNDYQMNQFHVTITKMNDLYATVYHQKYGSTCTFQHERPRFENKQVRASRTHPDKFSFRSNCAKIGSKYKCRKCGKPKAGHTCGEVE
jgi:hypothetical protein